MTTGSSGKFESRSSQPSTSSGTRIITGAGTTSSGPRTSPSTGTSIIANASASDCASASGTHVYYILDKTMYSEASGKVVVFEV